MADIQGFLFDFSRVTDFFDQWNVIFKTTDMDGSNRFQLVFCTDSPTNIQDCLDAGKLNSSVTIADGGVIDCGLTWKDETITLSSDVTFNIGDEELTLKSVFLRHKASQYVMGYSININAFDVTNEVIFDEGTVFYSIFDEGR